MQVAPGSDRCPHATPTFSSELRRMLAAVVILSVCACCSVVCWRSFQRRLGARTRLLASYHSCQVLVPLTCMHICILVSAWYHFVCVCVCVFLGKKLLGRSQVRAVAEKRRDKLNDYCKVCTLLSPEIFTTRHIGIPKLSLMNCTFSVLLCDTILPVLLNTSF